MIKYIRYVIPWLYHRYNTHKYKALAAKSNVKLVSASFKQFIQLHEEYQAFTSTAKAKPRFGMVANVSVPGNEKTH